jgi:3,4-dihydroxy 2-butanone 4-phosphate synthase/GTP cyclohydrolase II
MVMVAPRAETARPFFLRSHLKVNPMTFPTSIGGINDLEQHLKTVHTTATRNSRPFTIVSYAQCIDGSIATADRRPLAISGSASMTMTHRLRAMFEGILIGINTVVADNPRLTVRLADGSDPQPIVLDTHLRTPVACRLVKQNDRPAWLASAANQPKDRHAALTLAGAVCLPCRLNPSGQIDLTDLLEKLNKRGVRSLMVEGGAKVITSFIHSGLADLFIITISPAFVGGLQAVEGRSTAPSPKLSLTNIHYERMEDDLVVWAQPGSVSK